MKLVRARLGDDVDDRAARAPELRREAVLINLKLLHRLFRELIGGPHAAAPQCLTEESVVVVHAVNLQTVQSAALPADREVAAARVAHHTGRERGEVLEVAPVDRQVVNRALIDRRGDRGAPSFDDCGFARHEHITRVYAGHVYVYITHREVNVERCLAAHRDGDILIGCFVESLCARSADGVLTGRQEDDAIVAFAIGRRGFLQAGRLVLRRDRRVGHSRTVRVEHAPFDVAGCGLRLGEGERGSKEQSDTQQD